MKEITKKKQIASSRKKKVLQHYQEETVPEVPEKFKALYGELGTTPTPKGNDLPKPKRFKKETQQATQLEQQKLHKEQLKQQKLEKVQQNKTQRKKAAKLLASKNSKGQPKLKNVMRVVYNKLDIKHGYN